MNHAPDFDPRLSGYTVRRLTGTDIPALQSLYEQCLDYMLIVDGRPADPAAVAEELTFVPPGKSPEDKLLYGFFDGEGNLVGCLDGMRGYPEESVWWIATLLLAPEARSKGLGERIVRGFAEFAAAGGAEALMLGVVEENVRAYAFWKRMGFADVLVTEPRQFGEKVQRVCVMRLVLVDAITAVQAANMLWT